MWEDGRKVAPRLAVQKKPVTNALLEHVWEKYGQMSGLQLSAITHLPGSPWRVVREQNPRVRSVPIPDDLIRRYFKRLADQDAA